MVLMLVLLAEQRDAIILAAEYRVDLAPLVLASLAHHINMILVLVFLTEQRSAIVLAAERRPDLASLVLASLVHHV
jgi:hypothetical protein